MAVAFKESQTKDNLMRAFAGESQARNRYTFAASQAKKEGYHVLEAIFTFTANQEKEHAEIFYQHLKSMAGENILVDGRYPVDIANGVLSLLKAAHHNEYEEYEQVYPSFAEIAKKEGFPEVAASFSLIAQIEKTHGDRFDHYALLLEKNQLFAEGKETAWLCLNCGHLHQGVAAPKVCPVCHHNQGYFMRKPSID